MSDTLRKIASEVVDLAKKRGATAADAFVREDESFRVTVRHGEVEKLKESASGKLRLRVFVGKRTATSQTSDLSQQHVAKLVDETVEMAAITSEDESGGLPDESFYPTSLPELQLSDPAWGELTPEQRIELARNTEASAL